MTRPPIALTIAGSDSGGGAGIQADLSTFLYFGVFGTTAITAVTAQNTSGVSGIQLVDPKILEAQLSAVTSDFDIRAVKVGMLGSPQLLEVVARWAESGRLPNLVVDPVLVSSTGSHLFEGEAREVYRSLLLHARLATPNRQEAAVLLGSASSSPFELAELWVEAGLCEAVITGSESGTDHRISHGVIDVLDGQTVDTVNTHGTGCTFSAAVAAQLARGAELQDAVLEARSFVNRALVAGRQLGWGQGVGPVAAALTAPVSRP